MNEPDAARSRNRTALDEWQRRLLPLMSRMLVGLSVFFLVASFVQLMVLHDRINHAPTLEPSSLQFDAPPGTDALAIRRMTLESQLEANLIARRYHQANIAMLSRVWVHYLGFVTGMILSLMGSAFILGRLSVEPTVLEGKAGDAGGSLHTASPGIALTTLGVVLMITTIVVHHEIETIDRPTYFNQDAKPAKDALPDTLPPPDHPDKGTTP